MSERFAERRASVSSNWTVAIALLTIAGIIVSYSASIPKGLAGRSAPNPFKYVEIQAIAAGIGFIVYWACGWTRLEWWRRAAPLFLVLWMALMLVPVLQGWQSKGAKAWMPLGPFSLQPSEIAKVFYIATCAALLSRRSFVKPLTWQEARPVAILAGLFSGLLLLQHDRGMLVLMIFSTLCLLFLAGMRARWWVALTGGTIILGLLYMWLDDGEAHRRLLAWINPYATKSREGYQVLAMLVAHARGGFWGQGLGRGLDKWGLLPAGHTDAIFCVIAGEFGFIGALLLVGGLGWMVWQAIEFGQQASSPFGSLLASGLGVMLGLQALINMGVTLRLMPITGLTLPFMSCGGSSLISCLLAAGMILSVSRAGASEQEA